MGKLIGLACLAVLLGATTLAYNVFRFDVMDPLPLSWTRRPEEVRLIELRRERRLLAARLGGGRRVSSLAGMPADGGEAGDEGLRAELDRLDEQIARLEAGLTVAPK